MMYEVGQEILNGQVVILTIDTNNLILSVQVTRLQDSTGNPLVITYSAGVTEMFVANILAGL